MQIGLGNLVVLLMVVGLAFGGIGVALADDGQGDSGQPQLVQLVGDDARKSDADDQIAVVDDEDDGDDDSDTGASPAPALAEGKTAAQWMASAGIYKQRWLKMKRANHLHAQHVRNLRASRSRSVRSQPRSQARSRAYSSGSRVARGGGGGGTNSGGGTGGGDT